MLRNGFAVTTLVSGTVQGGSRRPVRDVSVNRSADELAQVTETTAGARRSLHPLSRFGLAAALILVAFAAWRLGILHQISPARLAQLRTEVDAAPVLAVLIYVVVFSLLTAACLPVALMLTLSGGVLFGAVLGGAATVVGATCAAVLTYLAARTALAPSLLAKAEEDPRMGKVMRGFGEDAFSYILTLRLIPLFPFSLVNIAAGLAAVPLRAYAGATAVGAVPTSFIYASLGSGLGRSIGPEHPVSAVIRSPAVILPLVALGLLSLAPTVIKRVRNRRAAGRT